MTSNSLYAVDPKIWSLDDSRVKDLATNKITQAEFLTLIKPEDPFELKAGHLVLVEDRAFKIKQEAYANAIRSSFKLTGGLSGNVIYDHKDEFIKVFPELAKPIADVTDIITKENCKKCSRGRYTNELIKVLASLPKGNRDLSSLEFLTPRFRYALPWLKGEPFQLDAQILRVGPPLSLRSHLGGSLASLEKPAGAEDYTPNRPQCINCAKKHIAQALVLLREAEKGYPEHVELAAKHLHKAEPDIAADKKESFIALLKDVQEELDNLDLTTLHHLAEVRRRVEEFLVDSSDPTALPRWIAIGHLAEAEDECVNDYPLLAEDIRRERLLMMKDVTYNPALEFILRKALTTPEQ
jgi:hypothetical protein